MAALNIEYAENLDVGILNLVDGEFEKFAHKNGVKCDYTPFGFIAKEDGKTVGVIKGYSFYGEVHIGELIVLEEYRKKGIGTRLLDAAEKYCADNGFESIALSTYDFQAPKFYKKCGFEVEFIRENKKNPKLTKYFLIKLL